MNIIFNHELCNECGGFGVRDVWRDKERILWRWCTCNKSIKLQASYKLTNKDEKEFHELLDYLVECKKKSEKTK